MCLRSGEELKDDTQGEMMDGFVGGRRRVAEVGVLILGLALGRVTEMGVGVGVNVCGSACRAWLWVRVVVL